MFKTIEKLNLIKQSEKDKKYFHLDFVYNVLTNKPIKKDNWEMMTQTFLQ